MAKYNPTMDESSRGLSPQLSALIELADQDGHMTDAAASLGIPQSTMSRRIHSLEDHLGVPLIVPTGRSIRLTQAGKDLADAVRAPVREIGSTLSQIAEAGDPDRGHIRFGFPLTMGSGMIPDLLADFSAQHPGISMDLKQAHGAELVDDLRSGTIDLAIIIPPPPDLTHIVIARQRIVAAVPSSHRLAGRKKLSLAELANDRFIANPNSYNLREVTDEWCAAAGFDPQVRLEATEFATIREFVSRGMGVALLPRSERDWDGVTEVDLKGHEHVRHVALCSAVTRPSRAVGLLEAFVTERAAEWSTGA